MEMVFEKHDITKNFTIVKNVMYLETFSILLILRF